MRAFCRLSFVVSSAFAGVSGSAFASGLPRSRGVATAVRSSALRSGQPLCTASLEQRASVLDQAPAEHPAFEILKVEMVDEYSIKAVTYRHTKSGAEVISAAADDDNKVFGIVFPTPVTDSTGVPHILEHSVLCGSEKYTSKEPFAELLKGSLQTFLNAFTYPDRTCYPVASQNTKDFYNLVNVYLDAVLKPRARTDPSVLAQEGWHYELEDPAEPLVYKGVVFNEMKGVYSSADSLLYRAAQQATFPDNTYAVDSGGDPRDIPKLSFAQFKAFHDRFYHPANSKIFFYGDDDLAARLELLDSYLAEFDAPPVAPDSAVETQRLKAEPWSVVEHYPTSPDETEPKHMVMLNWLLHEEPLSAEDELGLSVLDHLLMGTTAAALFKPLSESGLGEAVVGGGLSDELKQATFSVGLKGVEPTDVSTVEELVLSTLRSTAESGFAADAVEASLNTIEFQLREFNTGSYPRGLSVMLALMPRWIYGKGAPMDGLRFEAPLASLKARLAAGEPVFEDLLRRMLLDNLHRNSIELRPDAEMSERLVKEEAAELAAAKSAMGEAEIARIISDTAALKEAQLKEDSEEDLATIPRVGLADLERPVKLIPTDESSLEGGGTLLTHPLPTAGVIYANVLLDLTTVPVGDLPLARLLSELLLEVGTSELDVVALQRRIGATTGGISTSLIYEQPAGPNGAISDPMDVVCKLGINGKATVDKTSQLLDLMHAVLSDANFDQQAKAVEVLRESKNHLETSFVSSGNAYASMRLRARSSLAGYIGEVTQGVSYYKSVLELLELARTDWPSLLARLCTLRERLLSKRGLLINLTADQQHLDAAKPALDAFVASLPDEPTAVEGEPVTWREAVTLLPREDEAFLITSQVNYVGASAQLFEPGEAPDGALYVAAKHLSNGFLWDNVRVVGGAYGGGCSINLNSGAMAFSSYRDPNLQATLEIYARAADELAACELTDEALEKAIVGAVGDLDSPLTADQKGYRAMTHYLTRVTPEMRQKFRDEVLGTSRASFGKLAERLRAAELKACIFGTQEAIDAANAARTPEAQISKSRPF